jgi:hypothetical protein
LYCRRFRHRNCRTYKLVDYAIVYVDTKDVLLQQNYCIRKCPDIDISGKENTANKSNSVADIARVLLNSLFGRLLIGLIVYLSNKFSYGVPLAPTATVGTNDTLSC